METNTNTENHTSETSSNAQPPRYAELQALVANLADDFRKFYEDGNKAAGTRVRNGMQELKNLAQQIRVEVQTIKNTGKPGTEGEGESESESEPS